MLKLDGKQNSSLVTATLIVVLVPLQSAWTQLLHPTHGTASSFEVASVRPNHTAGDLFTFRLLPTRFVAQNAPLDRLIRFAYDVKSARQVLNMPGWARSESFNIDAKIGDAEVELIRKMSPDEAYREYRVMLQSLLADRFQMRVKIETRELPVYALVVKDGAKLTPSAPPEPQRMRLPRLTFHASGDLTASCVSMPFFAGWLSGRSDTSDRVVIDKTGLTGSYDFALIWNPFENGNSTGDANTSRPAGEVSTGGDKPPLLTAIQEQLGLRLEPKKAPVEVMMVAHLERPTPD